MKHLKIWTLLLSTLVSLGMLTGCELESSGGDDDNGSAATGDRAKITGAWKVDSEWRWSQMTFKADGTRSVVDRETGETLTRGTWSLEDGKLVVVSDVTEEWDYTVTKTTLTATLPSGTVINMTKVR